MKKIIWVIALGSVLLLVGCSGNRLEKARKMMENGDYKAAIEILEAYDSDEDVKPVLQEARLKNAIADAKAAIEAEDYSTAVTALESFKYNDEALELYNTAIIQVYTELLTGYWQNNSGETLDLAYIKVEFADGIGTAVLEHSVDNFYGYSDNDIMWKSIKVSENGILNLSALHRKADYASQYGDAVYDDIAAVLDPEENTVRFSDKFFGEWKKITEEETQTAAQANPRLTKNYNGVEIISSPTAIQYLGKKVSEASVFVFSDSSFQNSNIPFYFYASSDDKNMNSYLHIGYVINGGSFNEDIYCGMTYAQLCSLEKRGIITDLTFTSISTTANFSYNVNGVKDTIELSFYFDPTYTYINEIAFFSDYYWQKWKQDYDNYQQQKQQQEAQKYIVYSRDNVYPFIGNIKSYVNSPYGQLALAEPYMASLFLGDICFIENSKILSPVFLMYQGDLLRTNYSITYQGRSYPVYRAVTVIE